MKIRATGWSGRRLAPLARCCWVPARPSPSQAQPAEDEETSLLVDEARRAIGSRDYSRAGRLLDQAIRVNPRRIDAYVLRATVHGALQGARQGGGGRAARPRARARPTSTSSPRSASSWCWPARPTRACRSSRAVVAKPPRATRPRSCSATTTCASAAGRRRPAFEAYFEHRPRRSPARTRCTASTRPTRTCAPGKADKSRATSTRRSSTATSKNEMARLGVAWSTAVLDCGEAMQALTGGRRSRGQVRRGVDRRARCALTLGNLDAALDGAERYRARRPDAGGWALLGDIRAAKGNLKGAETAFTEAVNRDPKSPLYALKLARAERLLGKHARPPSACAAPARRRATTSCGRSSWPRRCTSGQYAQVRDHLEPWVQTHPKQPTGRFLLGASL